MRGGKYNQDSLGVPLHLPLSLSNTQLLVAQVKVGEGMNREDAALMLCI